MNQSDILERTRLEVKQRLAVQGAGHGFDHVERVTSSALLIADKLGGDRYVVELAALLHDVGDAKFHDGQERSGEFAREILAQFAIDDFVVDHVVHIVENISFRKRHSAEALSLEGKIVQDADRLDALGAVGIVRTIEYGASVGQPFYDADHPQAPSGVAHFYEKLFKLRELMNTEEGKRLAMQRESFMRSFLKQFFDECGLD